MKKLLLSIFAVASMLSAHADEGMWIPMLIGKNYDEMVKMGLKLSKDDLYNINSSSVKDAVIQFGGGCTGEIISANGLLITNHHCGYGAIAALSSVEKNYLDNGFWAYNYNQELPAKDITALFLDHIEDVTAQIPKATKKLKGEKLAKKIEEVKKQIEDKAAEGKKYTTNVKEYFNGNQYLLLVYKKYTDVRLVATPPKSLGKYGGKDNQPADYAVDNVPLKAKRYLPISIKGVSEGDFAMIFGYPGRTNRYEISQGVAMAINDVNPSIVKIRDKRLAIMRQHMDADKAVYLKLTSQYASIANYWKYFIGQTEQLKRLKVVEQKADAEKDFTIWAGKNAAEYKTVINEYSSVYKNYQPYAKYAVYYSEAFRAPVLTKIAASLEPLQKELAKEKPNRDTVNKYAKAIKTAYTANMHFYDAATDKELFAEMTKMFYNDVPQAQQPGVYQNVIFKNYGSNSDKAYWDYANYVYSNTMLLDSNKINALVKDPSLDKINSDAAFVYAVSFIDNYKSKIELKVNTYNDRKKELSKLYVKGLMEKNKNKLFYPDANSTMRITYGKVLGYDPQDAVHYDYFTTLDGFVAKYKPNDDEFDAPKELLDLYKNKDYGMYVDKDGTLHTCFITTNDITGGNSGSPVINGNGEWIGIAFDGNWEAMSGDIAFDKNYKRTICTDSRFILWVIEKMGKAHNLLEEMDIRK
ncbi:MAG: S46 family peptidase [Sphingobacteriales bacterium]|nr:MAG: S46 family peptidase [Sphingobacteriales bacterium]